MSSSGITVKPAGTVVAVLVAIDPGVDIRHEFGYGRPDHQVQHQHYRLAGTNMTTEDIARVLPDAAEDVGARVL